MEEVQHETATSWVAAMNHSHELWPADDPKRRMLGFIDHTDERYHLILLPKAKATTLDLPESKQDLIRTDVGRRQLIEGE